ncbi:ATP-dependent helicase [Brachybacterium endophyticum]|uniref:ATP-dependent helicase n=1 Tax=Brachybacterium endophyticum TaxID=2182385 RepID=A0A2U2RPN3_9MICO|nr:DEAD/DEAH box helicase [Brachybacterium endophyticum]PWH07838.1 ATP-dependent helicase [Brachybacterium endophyticum]
MPGSDLLPHVPPTVITHHVGSRSAGRGLAYAREGRVQDLVWDPDSQSVSADVAGTERSSYRVTVGLGEYEEDAVSRRFMTPEPGGLWRPVRSRCTCPIGADCKHVAAVLYHLDDLGADEERRSPPSEWRSVLRPLLTESPSQEVPQPLAIRFDLEATPVGPGRSRFRRETATPELLRAGADVWLGLRPMTMGRKGTWIKGGLSWRTFEFRMAGRAYHTGHAEALTRMFASATAERSYASGSIEHLWLNSIGSPLIWQSLAYARDAGVEFLPGDGLASIDLVSGGGVEVDLRIPEGSTDLRVSPRITIEGQDAPTARPLGTAGVIALEELEEGTVRQGRAFSARIAPVGAPVPTALQRLFQRPEPLVVPAEDREDFLEDAYPRLRVVTSVTSSDGSVEMPAIDPATLHLSARYTDGDRLTLTWSWRYHDPARTLPMDQRQGVRRDTAHEDEVLARVRTLWPTAGSDAPENLSGPDTARFSEHVLDALGELPHVSTEIVGTRHAYRELDGAPQVRITQTQSPGKHDWFDLGFEVTIDGRQIPFPTLFTALAQGRSRIMLPDKTYFSLDNPAFDALRELIAEGEALAEWDPQQQSISRFQLGMWEDLEEIAESARASSEWEASVGALRDVGQVETPPLPRGLTADLRHYQREGFAWLSFLFDHSLGGVLADDMGLGKTVQTLALIARARESAPVVIDGADGSVAEVPPPFLVVAPSSVLPVWRAEAEKFTPGLDVRVVDRTSRARGGDLAEEIRGADLVVTSYTVLRIDDDEFARQRFQGLVLDEAQFVKNRRSRTHQAAKGISANFHLAITGTPMENSLDDLWSILELSAPGLLGSAIGFRQRYTLPIENGEHPERMDVLRSRLRPFMLRRTKEMVATELPEKQEQVLTVTLGAEHRALYDSVLQRERKKVLGLIEEDMDRNRFIVFRSLTLLRMMALDPSIVDAEAHGDVPSSKLEALFDRLDEVLGDGHRVLLFSQFTSHLRHVADELTMRGVAFSYLDGSTRDRDAAVREFREGENPVFLISLKAGGFGLTLTEADYVFLLDPWWNPAAENQAVDRAHRIGQERQVMVFRMVAEDTIEEKVLALQQRKAALFDALTDSGKAFRSGITADDIRELLS